MAEPEAQKPLHAPAPETVDTTKEREEQDKLRKQQADLLAKQDADRRAKQNADDKKRK